MDAIGWGIFWGVFTFGACFVACGIYACCFWQSPLEAENKRINGELASYRKIYLASQYCRDATGCLRENDVLKERLTAALNLAAKDGALLAKIRALLAPDKPEVAIRTGK